MLTFNGMFSEANIITRQPYDDDDGGVPLSLFYIHFLFIIQIKEEKKWNKSILSMTALALDDVISLPSEQTEPLHM